MIGARNQHVKITESRGFRARSDYYEFVKTSRGLSVECSLDTTAEMTWKQMRLVYRGKWQAGRELEKRKIKRGRREKRSKWVVGGHCRRQWEGEDLVVCDASVGRGEEEGLAAAAWRGRRESFWVKEDNGALKWWRLLLVFRRR
ncbi:hypothetical protein HAX54_045703 [Datura stramonium]|uniref:Uncharacterized protein n=1 Tax=Datura stramonium TaxID=4076 RepID=A0ABS8WI24_DATST|nr:hypothetical protein [Datura stramonium]